MSSINVEIAFRLTTDGNFFEALNEETSKHFQSEFRIIEPEQLYLSQELIDELYKLDDLFMSQLNPIYQGDPSLWLQPMLDEFYERTHTAFAEIKKQVKPPYNLSYSITEEQEDAELEKYLENLQSKHLDFFINNDPAEKDVEFFFSQYQKCAFRSNPQSPLPHHPMTIENIRMLTPQQAKDLLLGYFREYKTIQQ